MTADLILFNGKLHTVDREQPAATAVAIKDGRFIAVGTDAQAMAHKGAATQIIDLRQRTVIPGLNDSHLHLIRGGLNYNLELRWEGVPSVADALRMLKDQAARTPTPQWVRVVGGWNEFQFAEKRMPTLEEINQLRPTPRCSCCTCTTVRCSTALRSRRWLRQGHAQSAGWRNPA